MRWPWQRRGRRRRIESVATPPLEQWAPGWAETFLPQPPTRQPVDMPPEPTVRLGFSDGSELELDESSGESYLMLVAAAGLVTGLRPDLA